MIANLITTLLLALGVATGSYQSESGNAFNHVNKKPIQRATENVVLAFTEEISQYNYVYGSDGQENSYRSNKGYLNGGSTPNFYTEYCNVYNTVYNYYQEGSYNMHITMILMRIDNYTSSTLNELLINTNITTEYSQNNNVTDSVFIRSYENQELEPYINKTITSSNQVNADYQQIVRLTYNQQEYDSEVKTPTNLGDNLTGIVSSQNFYIPSLPAHSQINIAFFCVQAGMNHAYDLSNKNFVFRLTGNIEVPEVTYEVVPVVDLMYTIITLPFAFYSTAFNLTIFPGTPYALNFGNLILTIVAALILLYLIKKVIK